MPPVALKIQRRRYARDAVEEIEIHDRLQQASGECREIVMLRKAFVHEEHVCMAFDKHGQSLESALERRKLPISRARRVTKQMLAALDHLHRCGYTHTDIKPDNILYDRRTGEARLADLGSATDRLSQGSRTGTREYMSPEVLLGAPLSPQLDLWSLGCTVFEMITGTLLFCPRKAAARKYREFATDAPLAELPRDERVLRDEADEAAEQYARGMIVGDMYRLGPVLGQGHFGTVWAAEPLARSSFPPDRETLSAYIKISSRASSFESERADQDREWRRAKGADDLLDLALNYEHILLITALVGPLPLSLISTSRFRTSYFEEDGALRFRPAVGRTSLRERLRQEGLRGKVLDHTTSFLGQLLHPNPEARASIPDALKHPWLGGSHGT